MTATEETPLRRGLVERQSSISASVTSTFVTGTVNGRELSPSDDFHAPEAQTYLHPSTEKVLAKEDPSTLDWFKSNQGFLLQNGLCIFLVVISIYDALTKEIAKDAYRSQPEGERNLEFAFDFNVIICLNAALSVVTGLILAACQGTLHLLFRRESFRMQYIFTLPSLLFGFQQFLTNFTLNYIPGDVMKTLDQSRLLLVALVSVVVLGRRPSRTTWVMMVVITLVSFVYYTTSASFDGSTVKTNITYNYTTGLMLVGLNALVMSLANVTCELYLKQFWSTPFYIQKIYLEIPNFFWSLFFTTVIKRSRLFANMGDSPERSFLDLPNGMFNGWQNPWVPALMICFFLETYADGMLVKRLSSVVKQMCCIIEVCMLYFFRQVHGVSNQPWRYEMIMINVLMFFAVAGYVFSLRDNTKNKALRKRVEELEARNGKYCENI